MYPLIRDVVDDVMVVSETAVRRAIRLLALESTDIDVEQIKWVVLMVLFSQPGQELAYARMEDLVFEETSDLMH